MRRFVKVVAGVGVVAVAYSAGALTVALNGSSTSARQGTSVIDQAEQKISSEAAKPVPQSTLQQAAVQGMLKALDDQWSAYYAPKDFEQFQQVLSGAYTGVGVWVRRTANGSLDITSVQSGSPAAKAGLRVGDVMLDVDGKSVAGQSVAEVVSGLRGDPKTDVTVVVRRGISTVTARLERSRIDDDDVTASMITPSVERLRVTAFTRGVGAWVRAQTERAQQRHLEGLVLDLRGDPGGLLDEAVETASAFLAKGPVVSYVQRGHKPEVLDALGGGNTAMPLVVLVDGGTASAAEIVAGALQDRGRAVVMGSQTFGKGSVQEPTALSDGSALELTVGHYLTPSGRSLDGVGITPDVEVSPQTPESVIDQRVVEVLSGLTADAGSSGRG